MTKLRDVAIVGGGPAGLALSVALARRGVDVVLFERNELPADKACGEGLMPAGVRALEVLGARAKLSGDDCAAFRGVRYVEEDGAAVEGHFDGAGGLGVRRTALSAALLACAQAQGAEVRTQVAVRGHRRDGGAVTLVTDRGEERARLLVAADGLHSSLRRAEGLDGTPRPLRRYGMRRHFALAPWSDCVEVHFADGVEAYVTPCGPVRVGVAFLWEHGRVREDVSFDGLLGRFPTLAARCRDATALSRAQGAGPFWTSARALVADRFVLLGDAAGYVDALTGEGVSLGLTNALALSDTLPDALARGAGRDTLQPYEQHARRAFLRYERLTRTMLALARRPRLRRASLAALRKVPRAFERLLRLAVG